MRSKLLVMVLALLPASDAAAQFGGKPPVVEPAQEPDAVQDDADDQRAPVPNDPQNANGAAPNAMFAAIDVDGNGIITKTELRKAIVALKRLDTDRDGNITLAEVSSGPLNQAAPFPGPAVPPGARGQAADANQGFDAAAFILLNDKNSDRRLSPRELPRQVHGMVRPEDDPDNNGMDMAELQAVMARMRGAERAWAAGVEPGAQPNTFRDPNRRRPRGGGQN
jgi:hypothetical protein